MQVCERRRYFFICFQLWSVLTLHRNDGGDFCAVCSAESAACGDPRESTYNRLFDCAHTAPERALARLSPPRTT